MPKYDYICENKKCKKVFEIEKKMSDPDPKKCPHCNGKKVSRYYCAETVPSVGYTDRPPWTYKQAKKFKTAIYKGKETKIDPAKHGDLGSWNSPGEIVKPKPKVKPKTKRTFQREK